MQQVQTVTFHVTNAKPVIKKGGKNRIHNTFTFPIYDKHTTIENGQISVMDFHSQAMKFYQHLLSQKYKVRMNKKGAFVGLPYKMSGISVQPDGLAMKPNKVWEKGERMVVCQMNRDKWSKMLKINKQL